VTISVQDLNDNAPAIRVNALTAAGDAEIEEHLPAGSFVAHVSVVDLDTGSSGQVHHTTPTAVSPPFLPRARAYSANCAVAKRLSVRLSVRPSHAGIVSNAAKGPFIATQLNSTQLNSTDPVEQPSQSFMTSRPTN